MRVRARLDTDRDWVEKLLANLIGGRFQALRGELIDVLASPGLVAEDEHGRQVGYAGYRIEQHECEVIALAATQQQSGVGTALIEALRREVQPIAKCIFLVTTNDNLDALRFYQRRGFRFRAVRPGAVDESRRLVKPSISPTGNYGIPIRDELELELRLD